MGKHVYLVERYYWFDNSTWVVKVFDTMEKAEAEKARLDEENDNGCVSYSVEKILVE